MAGRKLTQKVVSAMKLMSAVDEPQLAVPHPDKTSTLQEIASQGIAAVNALAEERNATATLAANLHLMNTNLHTNNQALAEKLDYTERKCEELMKYNSRLGAHLALARDLFARIGSDLTQVNLIIETMPRPSHVAGEVEGEVDASGLPVTEDRPEYDANGIPLVNGRGPSLTNDEISSLLNKLEEGTPA